jgi:hypothetical protein
MKTADPELMRAINRFHIIDTIRHEAPIARVEIADRTELSRATVSAITGALIEDGLVNAVHVGPSDSGARGRPRVLLELNGSAYHVAGVTLSADRICVAVTDFKGCALAVQVLAAAPTGQSPEAIARQVESAIRSCVTASGIDLAEISAIGIGLPGIIDGVAGLCHWSPILGPDPVPFAEMVAARLGIRTVIETEANLVTLAEHWFGHGRGLRSFAVLTINDTLGLGLMTEGRLYRGARGIGMEFGHMKLAPDGPLCRCGQAGCLDAIAAGAGLAAPPNAHQTEAPYQRAVAALGLGVAHVINLLNPPRLIISGDGLRAGALLQEPLLRAVDAATLHLLRATTEIVFHPWTDEMLARGAASIVLRQIDEAPWSAPVT